MAEIIVPRYWNEGYFECRLCRGKQLTTFSVTMPDGHEVIHSDAEDAGWRSPFQQPTTEARLVKVPGRAWLLCDSCWRKHKVEAVMQELMK